MSGLINDLDLDKIGKQLEEEKAVAFLSSMRGKLIINRALYIAIKEMEAVEDTHKEVSDIADMVYLRDTLFGGDMFTSIFEFNAALQEGTRVQKKGSPANVRVKCKAKDLQEEISKAWGVTEDKMKE